MKEGLLRVWWPQDPTEQGHQTPLRLRPGAVAEAEEVEAKTYKCMWSVGARRARAPFTFASIEILLMNYRIAGIAAAFAFASGLVVGHYASPRERKISTERLEGANKPIVAANAASRESNISRTSSVDVSASASAENLIHAIQNAVAHLEDRQLYSEVSDLIS